MHFEQKKTLHMPFFQVTTIKNRKNFGSRFALVYQLFGREKLKIIISGHYCIKCPFQVAIIISTTKSARASRSHIKVVFCRGSKKLKSLFTGSNLKKGVKCFFFVWSLAVLKKIPLALSFWKRNELKSLFKGVYYFI